MAKGFAVVRGVGLSVALALSGAGIAAAQPRSVVEIEAPTPELADSVRAVLPERDRPQTRFAAERLADEAAGLARQVLRAEGYFAGSAEADVTEDPLRPVVRIEPGPRGRFTTPSVVVQGVDTAPLTALAAQTIVPGAPARTADVLKAEAAVFEALLAQGYLEAKRAPRGVVFDHATGEMAVRLAFDPGPLVRLGQLTTPVGAPLSANALASYRDWQVGATASPDDLTTVRTRLLRTGAFRRVETRLAEPSPDGRPRDVVVLLEPAAHRTLELGASWSTTEGFGADLAWTGRNLAREAETWSLSATLASQSQALGFSLARPNGAGHGRLARLSARLAREDLGPFRRQGLALGYSAEAEPPRRLGLEWAASYGADLSFDAFDRAEGLERALVLSGFAALRAEAVDNPLDSRRGFSAGVRLEPAVSTGQASTAFARLLGDVRAFHTPSDGPVTFAARGRAGWVSPLLGGADDLPLDRLFYAGGGGSVRGFGFNAIAPERPASSGTPPGGQGVLELSFETRWRLPRGFGLVAFTDAGTAFDDLAGAGQWRAGAGFGLRYDLGFAPLRLDLATPLNRRPNEERVAVYLSIGQAF